MSLTDQRYLSMPQHGLSLEHYANIFGDNFWFPSIVKSFIVASISTIIATTFGTLAAIGCWRLASRTSELVRALVLLPLVVPTIVHALGFYRTWIDLNLLDTYPGVILADGPAARRLARLMHRLAAAGDEIMPFRQGLARGAQAVSAGRGKPIQPAEVFAVELHAIGHPSHQRSRCRLQPALT